MIKEVFRESIKVTKQFWRRQVLSVLAFTSLMVIAYYQAFIRRDFIDLIVSLFSNATLTPQDRNELVVLGILLLVLWFVGYLINFIGEYLIQSLGPLTLRVIAERFIDVVHRVRPSEALRRGDILARFTSDIPYLSELLGGLIPAILIQVIRLGVGAYILYKLNVWLTILAIALIPLYYLIFRFTSKRIARATEEERRALSSSVEFMKLSLDHIGFIRATLNTKYFIVNATRSIRGWMGKLLKLIFYRVFFTQTFHNVYSLVSLIVLIVGGYIAYLGLTTIGTLIAFTGVMYNLYEPITNLSNTFTYIAASTPYLKRYREVISLATEDEDIGIPLDRVDDIVLDDVEVEFKGHKILRGVSLSLRRGMLIGIVGPSGSGKTTLLLTLIRFFEPKNGSVVINGRDYRVYSLRSLRSRVRYVSPHDPLLNTTVFENLTLGMEGVKEDQVRDILSICRVDFISSIHDAIDPSKLSDGQKQRLILARALLSSPDVLLIDEALNAVDSITEDIILSKIKEKFRDRVIVVVSHRATALKHADVVYVMDNGTIIDKGKHEELYRRCALYRELIIKQRVTAHQ